MGQPLLFVEAIQALERDPSHPVRVRGDEELTVEVRAVGAEAPASKTIGEFLREIGRWEGETGRDLDALFTRQPGNRHVPQSAVKVRARHERCRGLLPSNLPTIRRRSHGFGAS